MLPIHQLSQNLKAARILIIDDSEPFQRLISEILKKSGVASVLAAYSLAEGMKFMHYNCYDHHVSPDVDLVLMDINLPDGNGMEGCRFITAHANSYNIPVVVISGTSSPVTIHEAFKAGASDYLIKPLAVDLLKVHLGMVLSLRTLNFMDNEVLFCSNSKY